MPTRRADHFALHVLSFSGMYSGHIPIAAVNSITTPTAAATIPAIPPSMTCNTVNASASATSPMTTRTTRSMLPTFLHDILESPCATFPQRREAMPQVGAYPSTIGSQ